MGRQDTDILARWGRAHTVRLLLSLGADPNAIDDDGRTPIEHAIECHWREAAEVLSAHRAGAPPD